MKIHKTLLLPVVAISGLALTSCDTPTGQGAAIGAGGGAIVGGLIGNDVRSAAIGAGLGAATGAIVGAAVEDNRRRSGVNLPVAQRTNRRGFVVSPYRPNNVIDVRGIPSGAVVVDPSTNGQFINP